MTLRELITRLAREPDHAVPHGFGEPMSYRGYYDELAFPPCDNTTVGQMLSHARSAIGATFTGYKGGDFKMEEWTRVWLAEYGESDAEMLGPRLLDYMLAEQLEEGDG